jgi:hypothetical protein
MLGGATVDPSHIGVDALQQRDVRARRALLPTIALHRDLLSFWEMNGQGIREQGGGRRSILLNGITSSAGRRWRVTNDGAAISPGHAVDGVSTTSVVSALAPGCPLHSTDPALLPGKFLA